MVQMARGDRLSLSCRRSGGRCGRACMFGMPLFCSLFLAPLLLDPIASALYVVNDGYPRPPNTAKL